MAGATETWGDGVAGAGDGVVLACAGAGVEVGDAGPAVGDGLGDELGVVLPEGAAAEGLVDGVAAAVGVVDGDAPGDSDAVGLADVVEFADADGETEGEVDPDGDEAGELETDGDGVMEGLVDGVGEGDGTGATQLGYPGSTHGGSPWPPQPLSSRAQAEPVCPSPAENQSRQLSLTACTDSCSWGDCQNRSSCC